MIIADIITFIYLKFGGLSRRRFCRRGSLRKVEKKFRKILNLNCPLTPVFLISVMSSLFSNGLSTTLKCSELLIANGNPYSYDFPGFKYLELFNF